MPLYHLVDRYTSLRYFVLSFVPQQLLHYQKHTKIESRVTPGKIKS
jgi:hypothetical protein